MNKIVSLLSNKLIQGLIAFSLPVLLQADLPYQIQGQNTQSQNPQNPSMNSNSTLYSNPGPQLQVSTSQYNTNQLPNTNQTPNQMSNQGNIIGSWRAQYSLPNGNPVTEMTTFGADGSFSTSLINNQGQTIATENGSYTNNGNGSLTIVLAGNQLPGSINWANNDQFSFNYQGAQPVTYTRAQNAQSMTPNMMQNMQNMMQNMQKNMMQK